jgi:hypothetical protein
VLGYALDPGVDETTLDAVLARCAAALRPGGTLLLNLAGSGRAPSPQRGWTEGPGWTVLVETEERAGTLTRRIVTFRDTGDGRFRRADETHRLLLIRPADVLRRMRAAGFAARRLPGGYADMAFPPGLSAYAGRRR